METKTIINRGAGDKTKGFTLQKYRAISLLLDKLQTNPNTDIFAAIEFEGDVYIQDKTLFFIEENKDYSSAFSFQHDAILNTLIYFLDCWLTKNQNQNIIFSFYTTTNFTFENKAGKIKDLDLYLPVDNVTNKKIPILEILTKKQIDSYPQVVDTIVKLIIAEYENQYQKKQGYLTEVRKLKSEDWIRFLNQIEWNFNQKNAIEIRTELEEKIKASELYKMIDIEGNEQHIINSLFVEFDNLQSEDDITKRFINKEKVELIFRRCQTQFNYELINDIKSNLNISKDIYRGIQKINQKSEYNTYSFQTPFEKAIANWKSFIEKSFIKSNNVEYKGYQIIKQLCKIILQYLRNEMLLFGRVILSDDYKKVYSTYKHLINSIVKNGLDRISVEEFIEAMDKRNENQRWEYLKKIIDSQRYESEEIRKTLISIGSIMFYKTVFQKRQPNYENVICKINEFYGDFTDPYLKHIRSILDIITETENDDEYIRMFNTELSTYDCLFLLYNVLSKQLENDFINNIHRYIS